MKADTLKAQIDSILDLVGDTTTNANELLKDEVEETETIKRELVPVHFDNVPSVNVLDEDSDENADYNFARSNLYGLIGRSNAAIELALQIAAESEHPRAIEVAGSLLKTSTDITKELIALHKKSGKSGSTKDIEPKGTINNTQINNNYYTGNPDNNNKDAVENLLDDLDGDKQTNKGTNS